MHSTRYVSLRALAAGAAVSGLVTAEPTPNATSVDQIPPDLTGQVPIRGFRLDQPFGTDDNQVDGWTLQINMTENAGYAGNRFVVSFNPPAPPAEGALWDAQTGEWLVTDDVGATWGLELVSFPVTELPLTAEGNNVEDGSCPDSVFSEQCRRDYVEAIVGYDDRPGFGVITPPGSCKGFVSPSFVSSIKTNASFTDDARAAWSYNVGGFAWQDLRHKTWPFIMVWGPAVGSGESLTPEHIHFNCVKADRNATTGELLVPGPSGNTNTTATPPAPTGSNAPPPEAGASLRAAWSGTVAAAAAVIALGVNLV